MKIMNWLFGTNCEICGKKIEEKKILNKDNGWLCQSCNLKLITERRTDEKIMKPWNPKDQEMDKNESIIQEEVSTMNDQNNKESNQKKQRTHLIDNSFGLKNSLLLCREFIKQIDATNTMVWATTDDFESYLFIHNDKRILIPKICGWTLDFKIEGNQRISINVHSSDGIKRLEYFNDNRPDMGQISPGMINFDHIEIMNTLMNHDARIVRSDCHPLNLSIQSVNKIKRPMWITPFCIGNSGLIWVDAETGETYDKKEQDYIPMNIVVDKVQKYSYPGTPVLVSTTTSGGSVKLSELLKPFSPDLQKVILKSVEMINEDIKKNYS
jgi:hypothetical protein